jgi:hypothetical protein
MCPGFPDSVSLQQYFLFISIRNFKFKKKTSWAMCTLLFYCTLYFLSQVSGLFESWSGSCSSMDCSSLITGQTQSKHIKENVTYSKIMCVYIYSLRGVFCWNWINGEVKYSEDAKYWEPWLFVSLNKSIFLKLCVIVTQSTTLFLQRGS